MPLLGSLPLLLAAALVAALVTVATVPWIARRALARSMAGGPATLPLGAREIPRLGGVAIALGIGAACGIGLLQRWGVWTRVLPREEIAALVVGSGLVFAVGLVDDLLGVSVLQKLAAQVAAGMLVVAAGWEFRQMNVPGIGEVDLGLWGAVLSVVWIVGVTNAINLVDGLDGLAGGVAAIIGTSLLVYSVVQGNEASAILLAGVTGACLGFLWHNWAPARIFMGDSGSLTLGFLFGAITLHSSIKAPAAVAILVPILALGLPVIDTLLVMVFRFVNGEQRGLSRRIGRMFVADRSHLHHVLAAVVRRRGRLVPVLYVVVITFCLGALAVALSGDLTLGLILLAIEIAAVFVMRRIGLTAAARELALAQRDEARRVVERWPQPPGDGPVATAEPWRQVVESTERR
jgi:UDP-GlcNAc:undecaprenyl-phosphate/decaprenyl-phosphate GlcNAc-1-phosphate transferase